MAPDNSCPLALQLKTLKEKLEGDACAVAMLEALGGIIDDICTDVCVSVHRWHRLDLLGLGQKDGKAVFSSSPVPPSLCSPSQFVPRCFCFPSRSQGGKGKCRGV
jgi:hypothetical protein